MHLALLFLTFFPLAAFALSTHGAGLRHFPRSRQKRALPLGARRAGLFHKHDSHVLSRGSRRATPKKFVPSGRTLSPAICTPSYDNFTTLDSWVPLTNAGTQHTLLDGGGVKLHLQEPRFIATDSGYAKEVLGAGGMLNSTWTMMYGRVTFDLQVDAPVGAVVPAILMGTETGDEIDVEILPAFPSIYQTNTHKPTPKDTVLFPGDLNTQLDLSFSKVAVINERHRYTIDWSPESITWEVDGVARRNLRRGDTLYGSGSSQHFPSPLMHAQLGIWDASSPIDTSKRAGGPIDWFVILTQPPANLSTNTRAERRTSTSASSATIYSVTVECPY